MNLSAAEIDALLTQLREDGPEDARTSEEWSELMRVNVKTARGRIKVLLRAGKMQMVEVRRVDMRGIEQPVAGYRLTA